MFHGLYAAVATPRQADGALHLKGLEEHLEFLLGKGIRQFAVNGATGEFCRTTHAEAEAIFELTADVARGRGSFLAGIGSSSEASTIALGKLAARFGAAGVLLPMPYFFTYSQDDLAATCRSVAERVEIPVLLYNLPQFSTGLLPETALGLIRDCPNIVGIKDSSGLLDCVKLLTEEEITSGRIIGNDQILQSALRERVCDGVVSGVASVLPELLRCVYEKRDHLDAEFSDLCARLDSFIVQLNGLPTPWGLKVVAEMRGLGTAVHPLSMSSASADAVSALQVWFRINQQEMLAC
jgi:4-hydroxy-tetrahydrodipicolinate synthase